MSLFSDVINCGDKELDDIITKALQEKNNSSNKVERLGFIGGFSVTTVFQGFIPLETRIKYSSFGMGDYSMKTTDFYYDFARDLRKNKIYTKGEFIAFIEPYINSYFGVNKTNEDKREQVLNDVAFKTSSTDEEYFDKLDNNEIGNLKGLNVAMCTERGAMAQNLLSLYGIESYYCIGCFDNGRNENAHCFNIAKAKNSYILLDYSVPVTMFDNENVTGYLPFQGIISNEEFYDVVDGKKIKSFQNYEYIKTQEGYKKVLTSDVRNYVVGEFDLELNYER